MSKAWDALDQTDREQLIGYVLGEHRDELGILYAIASDHEDREVRAAAKVAEAALQRCCAMLARRYEGDLTHAMETRRGEAAVSMLAKVLGLVRPSTVADTDVDGWVQISPSVWWRPADDAGVSFVSSSHGEMAKVTDGAAPNVADARKCQHCGSTHASVATFYGICAACVASDPYAPESMRKQALAVAEGPVGVDGTQPRVPVPPKGWKHIGTTPTNVLYAVTTGDHIEFQRADGRLACRGEGLAVDLLRKPDPKQHIDWTEALALYDAWKAKA